MTYMFGGNLEQLQCCMIRLSQSCLLNYFVNYIFIYVQCSGCDCVIMFSKNMLSFLLADRTATQYWLLAS